MIGTMWRGRRVVGFVVAVALVLPACGGGLSFEDHQADRTSREQKQGDNRPAPASAFRLWKGVGHRPKM